MYHDLTELITKVIGSKKLLYSYNIGSRDGVPYSQMVDFDIVRENMKLP